MSKAMKNITKKTVVAGYVPDDLKKDVEAVLTTLGRGWNMSRAVSIGLHLFVMKYRRRGLRAVKPIKP